MTFDPATVALGKKLGVVDDPRTFHLRLLLEPMALPPIPRSWRMAGALQQVPMFANDRISDCTCASTAHRIIAQERSSQQHEIQVMTADVIRAYSAVTGYDPQTGANDHGAYMLDVANYMRRTGMGRERDGTAHTVEGFVKVDHTNEREVETACMLFGGLWVGAWLPETAQAQTGPGKAWDVERGPLEGPAEPGSWGGHAFTVPGFDQMGMPLWTWGQEQRMTWDFWHACVDEAYAFISEDWFRKSGTTPRGFKLEQLRAWLRELA